MLIYGLNTTLFIHYASCGTKISCEGGNSVPYASLNSRFRDIEEVLQLLIYQSLRLPQQRFGNRINEFRNFGWRPAAYDLPIDG